MATIQPCECGLHEAFDALFRPKAVAIVGASGRADNPFARPLEYLTSFGFGGSVFPINPGYTDLFGLPCYASLADLPESIDLALVMIPAQSAIDVMPDIAKAGARAAVIFASGFGETGETGVQLQRDLLQAARNSGVRLIGPNCQGVLSTTTNMYGTFTAALENGPIASGSLAYTGQSGAVGGSILSLANERGIGVSSWVSTGNQADLDSMTVGRYLIDQDDTATLAMYLESATDDRAFVDLAARAAELHKPLIVLRSAVSEAGARAAASHTGAIVGDSAAFDATVATFGVIEARDIDELIDFAHANTALPSLLGPRIGVVTTSGGAGSLASDHLDAVGLDVHELSVDSRESLSEVVPAFGAVENPVDVTAQIFASGEAGDFVDVCNRVESFDEIDGVLIALTLVTGNLATRTATALAELMARSNKPIVIAWAAAREQTLEARQYLRSAGLPIYDSVGTAARALASLRRTAGRMTSTTTPSWAPAVQSLVDGLPDLVTESKGTQLLQIAGVPRLRSVLVDGREAAQEAATEFSEPVVLKIQSAKVLHKSDLGGVLVGIPADQVSDVAVELLERFVDLDPEGVLIQELAPDGLEFIVGVTRSEDGLPLVTVGLGGTATELFRDTATAFAPVDADHARELVLSLRSSALLTGFRGDTPYDVDALARAVSQVSELAVAIGPRLRELEVNPLRVSHDPDRPVLALDFLMHLTTNENT